MAGFKRSQPGLAFASEKITPDEIDRYEIYTVINPAVASGLAAAWFGTWVVAGTAAANQAMVVRNAIADYPRSLEFAIAGSATGMAGTATVIGRDQFGVNGTEVFGFGSADNGGTVLGTKVFASVTSASLNFGTAVGNGTARLGVDCAGTTALFGLPVKIAAATDVRLLNVTSGTGAVSINGGTIAGYVDTVNHAIKAPKPVVGTQSMQVWIKSSFDATNIGVVSNLPQRT